MPLEAPNLDDRRFAEIFQEARTLIPRYAPEWTDHNLSDPGITLMQLFAWLGEILLFRFNQVPERNYIKFLQLIGVEQKPAFPASAELSFTLASPAVATRFIPKGTRVGAEVKAPPPSALVPNVLPPEPEEPVTFETDEPLIALNAVLAHVQVFDGIRYVDYTEPNSVAGEHYFAFGSRARESSALLLGLASNHPFPTAEINLAVRIFTDPAAVREHSCDFPEELIRPPATIAWEYWNGGAWRKLDVLKDETRALTNSGHVYVRGPGDIEKALMGTVTDEDEPLYWLRCHLVRSQYEIPPELDAVLINTVRATAVVTVRDEVVGGSNGQPKQSFRLRRAPVFAQPPRAAQTLLGADACLHERAAPKRPPTETEQAALNQALRERELRKGFLLEVDESRGFQPWEEVEDFFSSGPKDRHYVLNRTTGEIHFGDGEQGRIPVAGRDNLVARYYRYGGGARGNVGESTIKTLQSPVSGISAVTNYWRAEGGADEEPVADTKARAPKELKARDRAVTAQDFEFLARQTPGVRRAHALPLYHPQFPDVEVPGVITVIVVPESKDSKPLPSEGTLQTVCAYLNQRRLLTTEVFVAPPKYQQVKIEANVVAKAVANPAEVKIKIETALSVYLHPLTGGADGQGWPLGGDVFYSEVFRVALQVEGVERIDDLRIVIDGERKIACQDAEVPRDFLVFSDGHEINVMFTS